MTATTPQAPPTEQVYGIAKRISLDLDKLPLHTHAAIINICNTMCQHRKIVLESEMQQKQIDAQEAAMAEALKAHAGAQVDFDARIAAQIKRQAAFPSLPGVPDEPKAPRLSIVLDKPGTPSAADLDAVEAEKTAAMQTALKPAEEPVTQ
jgi:hypothetical protein